MRTRFRLSGAPRRAGLAALLATAIGVPAGAEPPTDLRRDGRYVSCEVISLAPGEPGAEWASIAGFRPDRRQRSFAWVDGEAAALLLLEPGASRRLEIEARASRPGLELSATVGETDLGARALDRQWRRYSWEVPSEALGDGPELVRLFAPSYREAKGGQPIGVAVASIGVAPLRGGRCAVPARIVERAPWGELLGRPPGSWLVADDGVGASRRLEIAFRGAWPNTRLDLYCVAATAVELVDSRIAGRGSDRRAEAVIELPEGCAGAARLAVAARGPGWAQLEVARAAAPTLLGRRGVHRLQLAAATLALGALLLLLARAGWRPPLAGGAPWADVTLVVLAALALRLWMLHAYPYAGAAPDEAEYIDRARMLVEEPSRLAGDTSWHLWQSWVRPPGYYLFLAALFALGGDRDTALLVQGGLSALGAGAVYLIGFPLFGRGAALAAGAIYAGYVGSIATFTRVLAEPLFLALALPALAALTWACRRPSWPLAALAGVLFAAAALVRSAPAQYVLLAALLLLAVHGVRRGLRPAAALLLTAAALLLPWAVRNARAHGSWIGLETVSIANLLHFSPDERFVPHADLDLEEPAGQNEYYRRLKLANEGGALERRRGEVTRAVLWARLSRPGETARRIATNAARVFAPLPDSYLRWVLSDENLFRVGRLTDLRNLQFFAIVLFGAVGMAANLSDRRTWPLLTWLGLHFAVITVLVDPMVRFRLALVPVATVFAGWTVARALRWAGRGSRPAAA